MSRANEQEQQNWENYGRPKEVTNEDTMQILECGKLALSFKIKYGILLMGKTKAGKTTSAHYMTHQKLKAAYNDFNILAYEVEGDHSVMTAKIGSKQNESQTQIPNCFNVTFLNEEEVTLVDCPGYVDTAGINKIISNGYFHYKIFKSIENVMFILVIRQNHLWDGASVFKNAFKQFCESFTNISEIEENILASTAILITHANNRFSQIDIITQFSQVNLIFDKKQLTDLYQKFRTQMLRKKKIFIFRTPQKPDDTANQQNDLLKRIRQKTSFWKRQLNEKGQVNTKNIKTSIANRLLDRGDQKIENFGKFYVGIFQKKWKCFDKILKVFQKQTFLEDQNLQFINLMEDYYSKQIKPKLAREDTLYVKYKDRRKKISRQLFQNVESSDQDGSFWLKKKKLLGELSDSINKLQKQNKATVEQRKKQNKERELVITKVLKQFCSLARQKSKFNSALNFCYEIYHIIDLSNDFFEIMSLQQSKQKNINKQGKGSDGKVQLPSLKFILSDYPQTIKDTFATTLVDSFVTQCAKYFMESKDFKQKKLTKAELNFVKHMREQIQKVLKNGSQDGLDDISRIKQSDIDCLLETIKQKDLLTTLEHCQKDLKSNEKASYTNTLKILEQAFKTFKLVQQQFSELRKNGQENKNIIMIRIRFVTLMANCLQKIKGQETLTIALYDFIRNAQQIFKILDKKLIDTRDINAQTKILQNYIKVAKRYYCWQVALLKAQKVYSNAQLTGKYQLMQQMIQQFKCIQRKENLNKNFIFDDLKTISFPKKICQDIQTILSRLGHNRNH